MKEENMTLFVESNVRIDEILDRIFQKKFDFGLEEGNFCYLVENTEIESDDVETLYKELYNKEVYFFISYESRNTAKRETFVPNYDEKCVEHEFIPEGYLDADTGIKKLCALIFHSQKENLYM